jgi:hypothetical protein
MVEVMRRHARLLGIALQQRAKFEHWLKFELADEMRSWGATCIEIEPSSPDGGTRADIGFVFQDVHYVVELKTPNTNWRIRGVLNRSRPITKNISEIIEDARKPPHGDAVRIVAFAMFPVPLGDNRWRAYLDRITHSVGIELSEMANSTRIDVPLPDAGMAQIVAVTFIAFPKPKT